MALHNHLLLNGYTNTPPTDTGATIEWMESLIKKIDMKILQGPFSSYVTKEGNRGITAVAMIETSHVALHVWDESSPSFIEFDLYTCGELDADLVIKDLEEHLGLYNYKKLILERSDGFTIVS